jgi:transcriptional regulator with XRE-family HTH domain
MRRRSTTRGLEGIETVDREEAGGAAAEHPEWRQWMRDLGRQLRRVREFLGLSQEQVARLAGVSQGAVSRLETSRGLATPLLVVVRINLALARELGKLDPSLLDAGLRRTLDMQTALFNRSGPVGFDEQRLTDDPNLEALIRLYRETPERHRPAVISILQAAVTGLRRFP